MLSGCVLNSFTVPKLGNSLVTIATCPCTQRTCDICDFDKCISSYGSPLSGTLGCDHWMLLFRLNPSCLTVSAPMTLWHLSHVHWNAGVSSVPLALLACKRPTRLGWLLATLRLTDWALDDAELDKWMEARLSGRKIWHMYAQLLFGKQNLTRECWLLFERQNLTNECWLLFGYFLHPPRRNLLKPYFADFFRWTFALALALGPPVTVCIAHIFTVAQVKTNIKTDVVSAFKIDFHDLIPTGVDEHADVQLFGQTTSFKFACPNSWFGQLVNIFLKRLCGCIAFVIGMTPSCLLSVSILFQDCSKDYPFSRLQQGKHAVVFATVALLWRNVFEGLSQAVK